MVGLLDARGEASYAPPRSPLKMTERAGPSPHQRPTLSHPAASGVASTRRWDVPAPPEPTLDAPWGPRGAAGTWRPHQNPLWATPPPAAPPPAPLVPTLPARVHERSTERRPPQWREALPPFPSGAQLGRASALLGPRAALFQPALSSGPKGSLGESPPPLLNVELSCGPKGSFGWAGQAPGGKQAAAGKGLQNRRAGV